MVLEAEPGAIAANRSRHAFWVIEYPKDEHAIGFPVREVKQKSDELCHCQSSSPTMVTKPSTQHSSFTSNRSTTLRPGPSVIESALADSASFRDV